MSIDLQNVQKAHFVGISGIGMSALAQLFLGQGKVVTGSTNEKTIITDMLEKKECQIFFGHGEGNIANDVDVVVYTRAIPDNNPELIEAKKKGIPVFSYPEMLGIVSSDMYTIAVSGTHGKTTTTAMTADILVDGGLNPTTIVGSVLRRNNSNFIKGDSKYFLVEACEHLRSFLNLQPNILIITNIQADHLDYYKDLSDVQSAFKELADKVPLDGYVVCNPQSNTVAPILENVQATIIDYTKQKEVSLKIPGEHNRENAQGALSVADILGIDESDAQKSLESFLGTWRRFEYKGELKNSTLLFDDYAHHPDEIRATISGFREKYPEKKLWIVFQSHMFSRTKDFIEGFQRELAKADRVFVVPIFPAREKDDGTISHNDIIGKNKNIEACDSFEEVVGKIKGEVGEDTIICTMGAGDVYKVGNLLLAVD